MDKKILKLIFGGITLISITACQKGASSDEDLKEAISLNLCQSKATSVGEDGASILSEAGAEPKQIVSYSLDAEGIDCSTNQSVSWKALGSSSLQPMNESGTEVISSYKKAGTYVMTAQIQTEGSTEVVEVSQKTVIANGLALTGPDVSTVNTPNSFSLVNVLGSGAESATWDFGDGSATESGLGPISHTYLSAGTYTVTSQVLLGNGDSISLSTVIQVLDETGGNSCLASLAISGPSEGVVGVPVPLSTYIPACLTLDIGSIYWEFGDQGSPSFNQNVEHTYTSAGSYLIVVTLYRVGESAPFVTLTHSITITEATGEEEEEEGTSPHLCPVEGELRQVLGGIYSEENSCGVNGKRVNSFRDKITERCQLVGEIREWVEVSKSPELTNEGVCQDQSCLVDAADIDQANPLQLGLQMIQGKYYLAHGSTLTYYLTSSPSSTCSSVSRLKTCNNGSLSGDESANHLICRNGCGDFGVHGDKKSGVETGSETAPVTCAFGEPGVNDLFQLVSDQQCVDGQVISSNSRRGELKVKGMCPTYSWAPTESYTSCTEACGGTQSLIHQCKSASGESVPNERCSGEAPIVTRVCDGDPASVAYQKIDTTLEEGGASKMCPRNEIGVIISQREVFKTKKYECINHEVALASEETSYGAWKTVEHCKQFVAYRCSGDSLSRSAALGRYKWMRKCQSQVPAIDEFLTEFSDFTTTVSGGAETLTYNSKQLYPTFARYMAGRDPQWKAPTSESSSCAVPSNIYVAAVCTASCATPEQQILTAPFEDVKEMAYKAFIENWMEEVQFVATMKDQDSLSSSKMTLTAVNQWVTELYDTENDILTFRTQSGGSLRVTTNHPVLSEEGSMWLASEFKVGDSLVMQGGLLDSIVSIEPSVHFGKVYNLFVESSDPKANVVSTNGYLNGTAFFQNEGADLLNHEVLRNQLIHGVFEE
ncbi:PKD domain-containing protein [bacterium]|nr:PKD domain-containing protein [bacterium]